MTCWTKGLNLSAIEPIATAVSLLQVDECISNDVIRSSGHCMMWWSCCVSLLSNYMYHRQLHWNRKCEVQYTMFVAAFPEPNMKLYSTWCPIDRALFNWRLYHSEHIYFMSYYKHFNTGHLLAGWQPTNLICLMLLLC